MICNWESPLHENSQDAPEATAMPEFAGVSNLYFLFASMSMFKLKDDE
jgi:hypothetical protein